jgi:hypothetical protein
MQELPASTDQGGQASITPEEAARRAAAARAYALSSSSSSSAGKIVTTPLQNSKSKNLDDSSYCPSNNPYLPPKSKTPTRASSKNGSKTLLANHPLNSPMSMRDTQYRLQELDQVGDVDYANFMRSLLMDDFDGELSEREMDNEDDEDYQCEEEQGNGDDDEDEDDGVDDEDENDEGDDGCDHDENE